MGRLYWCRLKYTHPCSRCGCLLATSRFRGPALQTTQTMQIMPRYPYREALSFSEAYKGSTDLSAQVAMKTYGQEALNAFSLSSTETSGTTQHVCTYRPYAWAMVKCCLLGAWTQTPLRSSQVAQHTTCSQAHGRSAHQCWCQGLSSRSVLERMNGYSPDLAL